MVAFVRTVANRCHACLRRSAENCRGCAGAWANSIMADYENDTIFARSNTDYSLANRQRRIIEILREAGKPLLAIEIDIADICAKRLKHWTLVRMEKRGMIVRLATTTPAGITVFRYSLPNTNPKEPTHEHPNHPTSTPE